MIRAISFACALLALLLPGVSAAHTNGAPLLRCYDCHHAEAKHSSKIRINGLPGAYQPGRVYQLSVTIESSLKSNGQVLGGFAVQAGDGELQVVDGKATQLGEDGILTHTSEGVGQRSWKFAWKAPQGTKGVDIRVMGVPSNGDFSSFGDPAVAYLHTVAGKP